MTKGRLLIVSPVFHGYWESIQRAFQQLGFEVDTYRYDQRNLRAKIAHKLRIELPSRLGRSTVDLVREEVTGATVDVMRRTRPDRVLAIKGDLLTERFHEAALARHVQTSVWVYDELPNTAFMHDSLSAFSTVASYSARDCATLRTQGIPCALIRDAFDPSIPVHPIPTNEIVQIGALYPARVKALMALVQAGLPVRSYGREWSRHPFDIARTWGSRRPAVPGGREMPRAQAMGVMAGAPAALNIHGNHDGFNMRTFEAAGAGAFQLIDRVDVSEIFEPGAEIITFTSHPELIESAQRALADPRWSSSIRAAGKRRALAEHTFLHRARQWEALWV